MRGEEWKAPPKLGREGPLRGPPWGTFREDSQGCGHGGVLALSVLLDIILKALSTGPGCVMPPDGLFLQSAGGWLMFSEHSGHRALLFERSAGSGW